MRKKILIFVIVGVLTAASFTTGLATGWGLIFPDAAPPKNAVVNLMWETYGELQQRYFSPQDLSDEKLFYGAIRGMIEAAGDPYTAFFTPEEARQFLEDTSGHFDGIGAEIGYRNNILTVITPLQNTPASRAGLKNGDRIISIDERSTEHMSLEEAVSHIRGLAGSSVKLQILRSDVEAPLEITIRRERINIPVLAVNRRDNGTAVIELYNFTADAPEHFREAALELSSDPPERIVLDLRNNPGGFLNAAVTIAGWLFPPDTPVVIERQRGNSDVTRKTEGSGSLASIPIAALINGGTASAAEILAGALRDERGVQLIGETTFGKGTIQEFPRLSQGAALKVTIGEWLTPKGTSLRDKGLSPDVEVKDAPNDSSNDPVLERAIEILTKTK